MAPVISESDFKLLFESAPALYMVLDPNFHIVALSNKYCEATMIKREECLGRHLFDVFPDNPDDKEATGTAQLGASLKRVLETKSSDMMAIQKYDIRKPGSGEFEVRYWSPQNCPIFDARNHVKFILHRAEDVTEFVRIKSAGIEANRANEELRSEKAQLEKVRQGQRMEAMGQLAGGVAHDFNNILATIGMTCERALEANHLPQTARECLALILENSQRAAALTRQLLAFSRHQVLQPKILNLNPLVTQMHGLLSRLVNENIKLEVQLDDQLGNTKIDAGQVEQIIMNLVVNARDAMPRGGKITISTSNVTLDKSMSSGNMSVEPGSFVNITVQDNGIGMSAATQARIFEPFFTTKPLGHGTGLGLATVYGIVKQNHGTIWVYSELQKGTVFKIYLPRIDLPIENDVTDAKQPAKLQAVTNKTILVAEDEKQLRTIVAQVLRDKGYVVHEAADGSEALQLLTKFKNEIHLLISDVIMPKMGGKDLAHHAAGLGLQSLRILFLSGYTEDVLDNEGISRTQLHFLEKPFRMKSLLQTVKDILDT